MANVRNDYRLRVTRALDASYIVRKGGKVSYYSANETPWALANLAGTGAAELRFALEDAETGDDAAKATRAAVHQSTKVEVLP